MQLYVIHVKWLTVNDIVPSLEEEHAEQTKQEIKTPTKESLDTLRTKATTPINPYKPLIPFFLKIEKAQVESIVHEIPRGLQED